MSAAGREVTSAALLRYHFHALMSASPPPLKRSRSTEGPPPLAKGRDVLREALDSLEGDALDDDLDAAEGEWLFKEGNVVKGPVAAGLLIQRLREGALPADTMVAREMGGWVPAESVEGFADILRQAEKQRAQEAALRREQAAARRRRMGRMTVLAVLVLVPFLGGAFLGRTVMKARPWDDTEKWYQADPPVLGLKKKPKKRPKPPPTPPPEDEQTVAADEAKKAADEEKKDDEEKVASRSKKSRDRRDSRRSSKKRDKKADKKADSKKADDKKSSDAKKEDAKVAQADLPRTLTEKQIMGGLAKGKRGLGKCIRTAIDKTPDDIPNKITLAFSVANDGKAVGVKLLERQVRGSTLEKCIQKAVGRVTWPKFYGERKYTEVPFKITKPKK